MAPLTSIVSPSFLLIFKKTRDKLFVFVCVSIEPNLFWTQIIRLNPTSAFHGAKIAKKVANIIGGLISLVTV